MNPPLAESRHIEDFDAPEVVEIQVLLDKYIESRSTPGKYHHLIIYADGTASCSCPGDSSALRSGKGRCEHVTSGLAMFGFDDLKEMRIRQRVSAAVAKVTKPKGKVKLDIETLRARRMASTSLQVWFDTLFQELLGAKQGAVLRLVIDHPGFTRKMLADVSGWDINGICPRIRELLDMGLVGIDGSAENTTGKNAQRLLPTTLAVAQAVSA
jgi:hypothetical protein